MPINYMKIAVDEAIEGLEKKEGGPFGAVIVKDDKIISRGHNMVLQTNDPTAHAEITCIRKACAKLGTFDLSDCTIYSTCEPCPMCYGAIHWAKLNICYYGATAKDAENGGFSDKHIYDAIRNINKSDIEFTQLQNNPECKELFKNQYELY